MSEAQVEVQPGSLEDRVAKRREALEKVTTDVFDVPGFEGVFKVELQIVGGKRQFRIVTEHERVRDEYQQNMRIAGDLVLAATVGFYEVLGDEDDTRSVDTTWVRLARAFDKTLGDDIHPRAALVRLIGDEGLVELAGAWKKWMGQRGVKLERRLQEDF
jgi:hypothetical protein